MRLNCLDQHDIVSIGAETRLLSCGAGVGGDSDDWLLLGVARGEGKVIVWGEVTMAKMVFVDERSGKGLRDAVKNAYRGRERGGVERGSWF